MREGRLCCGEGWIAARSRRAMPRASLTSTLANSQLRRGNEMLKLILRRSPSVLRSMTTLVCDVVCMNAASSARKRKIMTDAAIRLMIEPPSVPSVKSLG